MSEDQDQIDTNPVTGNQETALKVEAEADQAAPVQEKADHTVAVQVEKERVAVEDEVESE